MASNFGPPGFLPESGYLRQSQLIPWIFPFSPATLWRKVKDETFPAPIKLSARITAWRFDQVLDWLEAACRSSSPMALPSPMKAVPKTRCRASRSDVGHRSGEIVKGPRLPSVLTTQGGRHR